MQSPAKKMTQSLPPLICTVWVCRIQSTAGDFFFSRLHRASARSYTTSSYELFPPPPLPSSHSYLVTFGQLYLYYRISYYERILDDQPATIAYSPKPTYRCSTECIESMLWQLTAPMLGMKHDFPATMSCSSRSK